MNTSVLKSYWKTLWNPAMCILGGGLFLKLIVFDILWSIMTIFESFTFVESYLTKLTIVLILLIPYLFFRKGNIVILLAFLLDILLEANLMYYRTYYSPIPLSSYGLAGNLADFMGSVYDSLRWYDILLPLTSVTTWIAYAKYRRRNVKLLHFSDWWNAWLLPLIVVVLALCGITQYKGGFGKAYDHIRESAYLCSTCAPVYSVFGCILYDITESQEKLTPQMEQEINDFLKGRPSFYIPKEKLAERTSCIVIFAESFESWVLERKVEGKEITPYLNKLLQERTTLYAPHVLTQVKGGRSIDAQLILCTGLLPINNGTYSSIYAKNEYPSIQKAMHQYRHSRNYLLTIDKPSTWNQGAIAQSFGADTIIAYKDFDMTETFGTHKRLGDEDFFKQCREKIAKGEVWKDGGNAYLQFVTYSGHAPFVIPEHLRTISFSNAIPQKVQDFMTAAHYTDKAIGEFVAYLKTLPQYKNTLVVIVGDHEGLAGWRQELCQSPGGRGLVSDKQFTPFIVLNSPVSLRYDDVMGQVDMYPTLLNLLSLNAYPWKGLGQSILDPHKKPFAVGSHMNVEGNGYTSEELEHTKKAYDISDMMIRFDFFRK